LFNFDIPFDFAAEWLRERLFEQKPKSMPVPVFPTRDFCVALLTSKVEATIRNVGDMIGWDSDNNTVSPVAFAAKSSILRLIPHMLPSEGESSMYRLVLEHGDFGSHNMSITTDAAGVPIVTSVYDWENGCIVPALLSDPSMVVKVDLTLDENGTPTTKPIPKEATLDDIAEYMRWCSQYFQVGHIQRLLGASADFTFRYRLCLLLLPNTNVQSKLVKMHVTSDLR